MKKKIIIIVGIIVAVIVGILIYTVISDLKQEHKLTIELTELSELTNEEVIDIDEINKRLDRTITTGDYAEVEDAFKSYLRDNFNEVIKITNIINDEKIVKLLTVDNYKADGKEFTESKKYISKTRQDLMECKDEYSKYMTKDKAMSYIENKNLDSYYVDLYKDEFVGDIESENDDKTVENSINDIIELLDISEEVINLLANNPDSWEINGEYIEFNNNSLSEQYDELINKLS